MSVSRVRSLRVLAASGSVVLVAGCNLTPPSYNAVKDPSLVTAAGLDPCPTAGSPVKGGLPRLTLHCLDGSTKVDLAGIKGPAIINLWYSACDPCKAEAPALEKFREAAKGKVLVLGIDSEPYPDNGLAFAKTVGLRYPSVIDEHLDVSPKLKVGTFPMSFFLDATGHLVGKPQVEPFSNEAQVAAAVKSRLGIAVS